MKYIFCPECNTKFTPFTKMWVEYLEGRKPVTIVHTVIICPKCKHLIKHLSRIEWG